MVILSWNFSYSLLPQKNPTVAQQSAGTSTGMPQAKQLTGHWHSPTYQQTGCLKNPGSAATSGHSFAHQRTQDLSPHTSTQAIDPRRPGPIHQWACPSFRSNSTHQQAGTRQKKHHHNLWTRTALELAGPGLHPVVGQYKLQDTSPHSQQSDICSGTPRPCKQAPGLGSVHQ